MRAFVNIILVFLVGFIFPAPGNANATESYSPGEQIVQKEYIRVLDITVLENESGEIRIADIGRYSPFRRYSWFRVGDVIERVDGVRTSIFRLNSLNNYQLLWVKYRRGPKSVKRQISLELSVYGLPPYVISLAD